MPLVPLKFKAGIVKDLTEYSAGKVGFYTDGNLVRFRNGYPTKIGGWQQETFVGLDASGSPESTTTTLQGTPKHIISWRASDGVDRLSIGTHTHVYLLKDTIRYDITPLRKTSTNLSNPITTTDESTTVRITDSSHGASTGDYVCIEEATAVGGVAANTLNRKDGYQITKVDNNNYDITVASAATSSVAGGGGTGVDVKYLIGNAEGVRNQSSDPALGWGVGTWGESTWGTVRDGTSTTVSLNSTQWSFALWGDDLLLNNRNGQIYYWDFSDGENTRATLVSAESGASDVPTKASTIAVSFPDRHVIAGGANTLGSSTQDPMLVRFSTQEDFTVFTPTSTNTSGDQRLEIGSKIVAMTPSKDEMIIQTDEAIYGMTFVGPPFTFSFRLLGVNCGAVAIHGTHAIGADIYWIGKSNFFIYNGSVQELPCSVQYYVFDRMQGDYIDKTYVAHNKKFNEISWFYVSEDNSAGADDPEPDSYVTYNYADQNWTIGTMQRNVWHDARGFRKVPFAFDKDGKLYNHETGNGDNGESMSCHIETGEIEIDEGGNNLFMVDKIIPDATLTENTNLYVELKSRKYPTGTEVTKGAFTVTQSTQKISTRAKGRQLAVKVSSTGSNDQWSLGDFRVNVRKDGLR
jgi:hypothetical protein